MGACRNENGTLADRPDQLVGQMFGASFRLCGSALSLLSYLLRVWRTCFRITMRFGCGPQRGGPTQVRARWPAVESMKTREGDYMSVTCAKLSPCDLVRQTGAGSPAPAAAWFSRRVTAEESGGTATGLTQRLKLLRADQCVSRGQRPQDRPGYGGP